MPKNIVICSDGTGNRDVKGRGTNVFKLFEAIDLNGHRTDPNLDPQIAFYDDGVGTEDLKPLRLLGGAAGLGLARNVRQLYRDLARVYDPGDRIFLFGFSRGAFTVRTLAGMIATCGIVNGSDVSRLPTAKALRNAVNRTYAAYRAGYHSYLTRLAGSLLRWPDRATAINHLHADFPFHPSVRITFIGVWDTVDAVGTPFALGRLWNSVVYQFKFPTQNLSPLVDRACHALSIDDERLSFTPVLWDEAPSDASRIEQVWFAGVHSNVGGGYPKQGMSLVALEWLLRKAMDLGGVGLADVKLRAQPLDLELYRGHASVDDKLYEPRAGTGVFYRWEPRDLGRICCKSGVQPKVHLSVLERIAHGTEDYAPGNLPFAASVVITPTGDPDADAASQSRAAAVEKVLYRASLDAPDLMAKVRPQVVLGHVAYWTFIVSWALFMAGVLGATIEAIRSLIEGVPLGIGAPWLWIVGVVAPGGFLLAWLLSRRADRKMTDTFSLFWHQHQTELRTALKQARAEARMQMKARHD